jgi:hypothetical protein
MALPGKPSTAHEYDCTGACTHCGMYRNVVEQLVHVCTKEREITTDGWWLNQNYRTDRLSVESGG